MQATYVSSNQFRVSTDKTTEFLAGRRIRANCGGNYKYSTIQSSVYSDPNTTVTIEKSILTSNLTEVHYGIVNIGDQGSFPNHSHNGDEGTGGEISLLTLSDTPAAYENNEYLKSTTSGVEWTIPEAETVVVRVKEENISAITKGQVCAVVTGSSGVKAEIGLCDCDDPDKIRILGLAQDNIPQNEDGIVAYKGVLTNVDTRTTNSDVNPNGETWISGDLLWSANTPGGMTNVRPISGRSIKAARTIKGNSATDALIIISLENPVWNTAAVGEDVVLRVGDSVGANKVSIRNYINDEVADFDSYGNLTVSGTAKVGGDIILSKQIDNGIKVDTDDPTFGWRDLLGAIRTRGVGATDPNDAVYIGTIKGYQFSVNDEAWIEYHIPHDYVSGSDIHLHFHWSHNVTVVTGGSVVWAADVTYAKGYNQAPFSSTINTTVSGIASTTQYQHIITEVQLSATTPSATQIDSDNLEPDGLVLVRVYLSANNITSSGAVPDPFLHFTDIHYRSTNIGTKQKAPNFYI